MSLSLPVSQPELFKTAGAGRMFALRPIFLPEEPEPPAPDQGALFDLSPWATWWGRHCTWMMLCPHCHQLTAYPVAGGVLCIHNDHGYRVAHAYPKARRCVCGFTFAFLYRDEDDPHFYDDGDELWSPEADATQGGRA